MRRLATVFWGILGCLALYAGPAYPGYIAYTQPDGSVVRIQKHGDEFYNWTTDENGAVVELGSDGYYRRVSKVMTSSAAPETPKLLAANLKREALAKAAATNVTTTGSPHYIVILAQFTDLSFTIEDPKTAFTRMLNESGYSDDGATGSALDYFSDNSGGKYTPVFDVVGPVTLSQGYAYYGANDNFGNDGNPALMAYEACSLAFSEGLVSDFATYDLDKDGYIDNVFVFYAGYNESESGDENAIWPHMGTYYNVNQPAKFGNASLYKYTCSSELCGSSGGRMTGIGLFCHEFGHTLGLVDFYDVNGATNGKGNGLLNFALMGMGEYNNTNRTPPNMNAVERQTLGWMDAPEEWNEAGAKTLTPIYNNVSAVINSNIEGDYYLFEVRDGTGWDKYICKEYSGGKLGDPAKGLVVYHVDQSKRYVATDTKAAWLWKSNKVNIYGSHQCFDLIIASTKNSYPDCPYIPFPGAARKTTFSPDTSPAFVDWDGQATGFYLNDIAYSDGTVTLNLVAITDRSISGTVTNTSGDALSGVTIVLEDGKNSLTTTTDSDGAYSFTFDETMGTDLSISAIRTGYKNSSSTLTLERGGLQKNFTMYGISELAEIELRKYENPNKKMGWNATTVDLMAAVGFTAEELEDYVGLKFKTIKFMLGGKSAAGLYTFIDFAKERQLWQKVTSAYYNTTDFYKYTTVDVEDADVVIPSNTDIYFGYAATTYQTDTYSTLAVDDAYVSGGGYYHIGVTTSAPDEWTVLCNDSHTEYYNIIVSATLVEVPQNLAEYGFLSIKNPKQGLAYSSGYEFELAFEHELTEMPSSVDWYYDGSKQSGSSVKLSGAGDHEIKAVLYWADGSTEELTQIVKVN